MVVFQLFYPTPVYSEFYLGPPCITGIWVSTLFQIEGFSDISTISTHGGGFSVPVNLVAYVTVFAFSFCFGTKRKLLDSETGLGL